MAPLDFTRLDKLIWVLIYGGLFLFILGVASADAHRVAAWSLGIIGALLAVAGAILIPVRARLREDAPAELQKERQP